MSQYTWVWGILLYFIAQILVTVGMQIQKCAHTKLHGSQSQIHYVFNPRWIIGFSIHILSAFCDFFALAFASQSAIAPIASVTLIINMCLTPIMQKEKVSTKTIVITICIAFGTVLTVMFSPKVHHQRDSIQQIMSLYKSYYFLVYSIITGAMSFALWILASNSSLDSKMSAFAGPTLSGMMSAQGKLLMKGVAASFIMTLKDKDDLCLTHWEWYTLLVSSLLSLFWHVKWLNTGLQNYSPTHVIPICWTFNILFTIIGGLVVFKEFQDFHSLQVIILFAIGVMVTLVSVLALSTVKQDVVAEEKLRRRSLSLYQMTPKWNYGGSEHSLVMELSSLNMLDNKIPDANDGNERKREGDKKGKDEDTKGILVEAVDHVVPSEDAL